MKQLIPICIFVFSYGIAFGVAATEHGLEPYQAILMSAFVFTATAQFAALDFLTEPVAFLSLAFVTLALGGRHIIMSAALSRWINQLPKGKRFTTLFFLSDPNFAVSQSMLQTGEREIGPLLGGGVLLWLTWVTSTALGSLGSGIVGNTEVYGFSVIMPCFFAATATNIVRGSAHLMLPVSVAMAIAVASYSFLPLGWNIILAAVVGGCISALSYGE